MGLMGIGPEMGTPFDKDSGMVLGTGVDSGPDTGSGIIMDPGIGAGSGLGSGSTGFEYFSQRLLNDFMETAGSLIASSTTWTKLSFVTSTMLLKIKSIRKRLSGSIPFSSTAWVKTSGLDKNIFRVKYKTGTCQLIFTGLFDRVKRSVKKLYKALFAYLLFRRNLSQ